MAMKAAHVDTNGDIQVTAMRMLVPFMAFMVAAAAASAPALLAMGRVSAHMSDTQRHEDVDTKERRIDERTMLHLKPIEMKLQDLDKKLDRLLAESP